MQANQGTTKKALREYFLGLRQDQSPELAARAGVQVRKHLLELECIQQAKSVLMYLPIRGEIDTWPLLEDFWMRGVRVFLPRCRDGEPGAMDVHRVRFKEELEIGHFGLTEPSPARTLPEKKPKLDVIVVPGVAFDYLGYRLGFGGGYYDRFLARLFDKPLLIGLAYDFQIVDRLPKESWDQVLDMIVSPAGVMCL